MATQVIQSSYSRVISLSLVMLFFDYGLPCNQFRLNRSLLTYLIVLSRVSISRELVSYHIYAFSSLLVVSQLKVIFVGFLFSMHIIRVLSKNPYNCGPTQVLSSHPLSWILGQAHVLHQLPTCHPHRTGMRGCQWAGFANCLIAITIRE
jgi:hypothetical protein